MQGATLARGQDAVVSAIEQRIAKWTMMPVANGEGFQVGGGRGGGTGSGRAKPTRPAGAPGAEWVAGAGSQTAGPCGCPLTQTSCWQAVQVADMHLDAPARHGDPAGHAGRVQSPLVFQPARMPACLLSRPPARPPMCSRITCAPTCEYIHLACSTRLRLAARPSAARMPARVCAGGQV